MRPLSKRAAVAALDRAMGEWWDDKEVEALFSGLRARFPGWKKTIAKIDEWAGDASNERAEPFHGRAYYSLLWHLAMDAVDRMYAAEKKKRPVQARGHGLGRRASSASTTA